ncbi:glycosyltransferase involved in cell wall biosynthesis [Glaciihabitans tibetensis]|uniref:Glycosyltransferase involved in cell wall biosynthesis n=1 Tax=Glaciihabitans tibetensis TaxID=1266600 RepID=A0A2T0VJL9_9MICO|nr:glycosyltransferase family 2 protein [Glaciihabitans tibetensis]PRY70408.1 glycosyltransferase involved in cell wall biosynthesis [Glaciihabitans tibetensis]
MRRIIRRPEKLPPRISVVIPARNEARNLEVILPELPPVHQVILVDGSSVDDTIATAQRVMPGIEVIRQTRTGKGNALACGFAAVTGDIVVMFDADGSADPAEIPAFVAALVAGADVAKGSRFCEGGGSEDITAFRRLGNYGLNTLTNVLLGTRYTDLCYGYNAFWSYVLPRLELPDTALPKHADGRMHWGDGFEIETVLNCRFATGGMRIVEVPSVERLRIHGESNLRAVRDGLRVLKTIWAERQRGRRVLPVAATSASWRESVITLDIPARPAVTSLPHEESA